MESTVGGRGVVSQGLRLHLGCGTIHLDGYVNIDAYPSAERSGTISRADRYARIEDLDYPDSSMDEIYTAHVFEHLSGKEILSAITSWHRILKPGGRLIIEVPDAEAIMRALLRATSEEDRDLYYYLLFGTQEFEGEFHKAGYTFRRLERLLADGAFEGFRNLKEDPSGFRDSVYYRAFEGRAWRCVLLLCEKSRSGAVPDVEALRGHLFFCYDSQDLVLYRLKTKASGWLARLRRGVGR